MVAALGGEETEEVLSTAFRIFQVTYGVQIVEADLLEEAFFGGRFVEREKVGTEDEVEGFPLLRAGALVGYMTGCGVGTDLGFPGTFMDISASKDTVEGEAAILIDWRKGIEVEVPASNPRGDLGQRGR